MVVPGAMLPLAGVTVIETRVAGEDLPPLHPERARIITRTIKKYLVMVSSFQVTTVWGRRGDAAPGALRSVAGAPLRRALGSVRTRTGKKS